MIATVARGRTSVESEGSTAGSGAGSAVSPGSPRDAYLDNAKLLLIALVFVGHAIEPSVRTGAGDLLYYWIYLFHMPAFVLICGYLAKSYDGSPRRVEKLVVTLGVPYLLFWGLYAIQLASVDRELPNGPLDPLWVTWFLAALFVWRLTVPLWRRLRWPIAVAIAVSFAAGMVRTTDVVSVSRILSLLPFFVTGLFLRPEHFGLLRRWWVRGLTVLVVLASAVITYTHLESLSQEWVYWRESLTDRHVQLLPYGIAIRVLFLAIAFALAAAVLSLVPHRRFWFTRFGAYTLYVYLLHGLVIRVAGQFGWFDHVNQRLNGHLVLAVNVGLAVLGTFLLCTPWVRRATAWAVEPSANWLLLPRSQPARPQSARDTESVGEAQPASDREMTRR